MGLTGQHLSGDDYTLRSYVLKMYICKTMKRATGRYSDVCQASVHRMQITSSHTCIYTGSGDFCPVLTHNGFSVKSAHI